MYPSDKRKTRANRPIDNRHLEPARTFPRPSQNPLPLMEPGRTASAVQVRNFKALLEAAGSIDDLALTLDMPLQRINQLLRGENFVRETVHHIEETLKLPSGFMDRLNARVMPDLFARLKESLRAEDSAEDAITATVRPSPLASAIHRPEDEADTSRPTPVAVGSTDPALPHPRVGLPTPNPKGAARQVMTHPRPVPKSVSPTSDHVPHDVLEIRRLNLAMLTEAPGAKGRLAHLMGMSPANVSHRIHKNKKLDDAETRRLTTTLKLPPDWFDTLRTVNDIPDHTKALLIPETKSRRNDAKLIIGPGAQTLRKRRAASDERPGFLSSSPMPNSTLGPDHAAELPLQPRVGFERAGRLGSQDTMVPTGPPIEALTIRGQVAVTTTASTVLLSLGEDDGMGPIARALLHTVFLKARAGDLDEVTALRLLQEVVALASSQQSQAA